MWKDYVEKKEEVKAEEPTERKESYKTVYVTELTSQLKVYCQFEDPAGRLELLLDQVSSV